MSRCCTILDCANPHKAKDLCDNHYKRWKKYGNPLTTTNRPRGLSLGDSFRWHMAGTPPEVGCWEWSSARNEDGYGILSFGGKDIRAHIAAHTIFVGPVLEGQVVRHTCDNPPCVSPYHLKAGTVNDNVNDRVMRDRQAKGSRINTAKMVESQVICIRDLYRSGCSFSELARSFGLDPSTVAAIVRRKTWTYCQ